MLEQNIPTITLDELIKEWINQHPESRALFEAVDKIELEIVEEDQKRRRRPRKMKKLPDSPRFISHEISRPHHIQAQRAYLFGAAVGGRRK